VSRVDDSLGELVAAAADGDQAAWEAIIARFSALVGSIPRSFRLSSSEASDVAQTTWLRLVENLDRIDDPERLGAWLATTARRESLRAIRMHNRELTTTEEWIFDSASDDAIDRRLLTRERDQALWRAFKTIGERCQVLLRLLAAPDPPSYLEVSSALDMPIGAIGPTRARCLEKLRQSLRVHGIEAS
jgi:RNA polymerase sigma factor (sigma-70 family)